MWSWDFSRVSRRWCCIDLSPTGKPGPSLTHELKKQGCMLILKILIWFAQLTVDKTIQHFKFQETLLEAVFMVVKAISNVSLSEWTLATVSSGSIVTFCPSHRKLFSHQSCIPDILMGSSVLFSSSPPDPESPETGLALVSIAWTKALSNIFFN